MKIPKSFALIMVVLMMLSPIAVAEQSSESDGESSGMGTASLGTASSGASGSSSGNGEVLPDVFSKFNAKSQQYTDLSTGSFSYTYPIAVPKGVHGLQPNLFLAYNSHQATMRSELGYGWSLSQSYVYRNTEGTRTDTSDDIFYLNMNGAVMKLVLANNGKYHTELESHMSIELDGDTWEVKTKDGTRYRFGYNEDSNSRSNQEGYTSMWYLDEVIDTYGNKISYEYIENPSEDLAVYLSKITYGANQITFGYAFDQWHVFDGFLHGTRIRKTGLLNTIAVENSDDLVRRYRLSYMDDHVFWERFLGSITVEGSDGTKLPSTSFEYETLDTGWREDSAWQVPSEVTFGDEKGTLLVDINGDGMDDLLKMENSNTLEYWLNGVNGWQAKQTTTDFLPGGFVDALGKDRGIRFVDINGDSRLDALQLVSGSQTIRRLFVNTGDGWQEESVTVPSEVSIVEVDATPTSCEVASCTPGYTDEGVSCNGGKCTRTCSAVTCSGSGTQVYYATDEVADWSDDGYEESDHGDRYTPQANKCYRFEYVGSSDTDGDDSDCYDLDTDDKWGDYDLDCNGNDIDAYAGIGFVGNWQSNSWLSTIPGGSDYGFTANVENGKWEDVYLSKTGVDKVPDSKGSNAGDWDGLEDILCDEGGTNVIHCAPSAEICGAWGRDRCGFGCAGEATGTFAVMGVYADYGEHSIASAFNDHWECSRYIDDNDYEGNGYSSYKVIEYNVETLHDDKICDIPSQGKKRDNGIRFVDVNGDSKVDIIKGTSTERKTWINTGESFVLENMWKIPSDAYFVDSEGVDHGVRIGDVNGDGLVDLVKSKDGAGDLWINTGKGWTKDSRWARPVSSEFMYTGIPDLAGQLTDLDGDGLKDILRTQPSHPANKVLPIINFGRDGWMVSGDWWNVNGISLADGTTQLADVNGDGIDDLVKASSSERKTYLNKAERAYLIKNIKNSFGGEVQIKYKKIAELDNTGDDLINDVPFSGWVVMSVTEDNGFDNGHEVLSHTSYEYRDGYYASEDNEFRGFGYVEEVLPDETIVGHYFHQDDAMQGLEHSSEVISKEGDYLKETSIVYGYENKGDYFVVNTDSIEDTVYEGNRVYGLLSTSSSSGVEKKTTRVEYEYDDYGNLLSEYHTGDGRKKEYNYYYDTEQWIVGNPDRVELFNGKNNLVRSTVFEYDGAGSVSKEIKWLNTNENDPETRYFYDDYGNLVGVWDAYNRPTSFEYDSTHVYPVKVTNAKDQETNYVYDLGTGNLLSVEDPNGFVTEYKYDGLGRKTKEILPGDSSLLPTVEYEYTINGDAPERVIVKAKESLIGTLDSYYYYDGFGRLVKDKIEAAGGQFVTKDYIYDAKGRLKAESNPHFTGQSEYVTLSFNDALNYDYDALDRVTKATNPDQSYKTFEYELWDVAVYNENGVRRDYIKDAFGNIIAVKEHVDGSVQETEYEYDATDTLVKITDHLGNEFEYTYDSLGRKVKLEDPDMGVWRYEYDDVGNLERQITPTYTITMNYDELNRLTHRESLGKKEAFHYDSNIIGPLLRIDSPYVDKEFEYDERLRKTAEWRIIDGIEYVIKWEYDDMNRVTKKILPNGNVIEYAYDNGGNLLEIEDVLYAEYNEANVPISREYDNGVVADFSYDGQNYRLTKIQTSGKQNLQYEYDDMGNVLKINDLVDNELEEFVYDDLDRLKVADKTDLDEGSSLYDFNYAYDALGNIMEIVTSAYTLVYTYGELAHTPVTITRYNVGSSGGGGGGGGPPGEECVGVTCEDFCSGTTRYFDGACYGGSCKYTVELESDVCTGPEDPSEEDLPEDPSEDDPPEDDPPEEICQGVYTVIYEDGALCSDGIDNDCDGLIDGDEAACKEPEPIPSISCNPIPEGGVYLCSDGLDNDCDGKVDDADEDCQETGDGNTCMEEKGIFFCSDGIDNDCDGAVDFADGDCLVF